MLSTGQATVTDRAYTTPASFIRRPALRRDRADAGAFGLRSKAPGPRPQSPGQQQGPSPHRFSVAPHASTPAAPQLAGRSRNRGAKRHGETETREAEGTSNAGEVALDSASNVEQVLSFVDKCSQRNEADVHLAALNALAQYCRGHLGPRAVGEAGAPAAGAAPASGAGDLAEHQVAGLEVAVRSVLSKLHARRSTMSFDQLADISSSLETLLTVLGSDVVEAASASRAAAWPLRLDDPRVIHDLLGALPAAASAAQPPPTLEQLSAGFRCTLRVANALRSAALSASAMADASRADADAPSWIEEQLEDCEAATLSSARHFLIPEVFAGAAARRRLQAADLSALAAAVELANAYALPLPRSFMGTLVQRVDELVAGASSAHADTAVTQAVANARGLALLVEACCVARCRGLSPAPEDAWLVRVACLVLESQDTSVAAKRSSLQAQLDHAEERLSGLRRELKDAKKAAADAWRRVARLGGGRRGRGKDAQAPPELDSDAEEDADFYAGSGVLTFEQEAEQAKAEVARLEAAVESASIAVDVTRAAVAKLGPAPAVPSERVESGPLVSMLAAVAAVAGGRAGDRLGSLAESVLLQRIEELGPREVVEGLHALALLQRTPADTLTAFAIQALEPHLPHLSAGDAARLLTTLRAFGFAAGGGQGASAVPGAAAVLGSLISAVAGTTGDAQLSPGVEGLPSVLPLWLVKMCEECGVQLKWKQQRWLERLAEERLRQAERADASSDAVLLRLQLLEGLVLPLCRMGRRLKSGHLYAQALDDWADRGFAGLEERTALVMLESYTATPAGRKAPKGLAPLLESALSLSPGHPDTAVAVLLAAARSMRRWAEDEKRAGPAKDMAAPGTGPLLQRALEHLLTLRPSAEQLMSVAHELFTELHWRGVSEPATGAAGGLKTTNATDTHGAGGPAVEGTAGAKRMLARMLEAAAPGLSSCGLETLGRLLAVCSGMGYTPPPAWMELWCRAVAAAVGSGRSLTADALSGLLAQVEDMSQAGAAADPAADAVPGQQRAREALLAAIAEAVLQEPVLADLTAAPGALVVAASKLAQLGLRPSAAWLSRYTDVLQRLAPRLTPADLDRAVETLRLLRATPPLALLDRLLAAAGSMELSQLEPRRLGLLLANLRDTWANARQAGAGGTGNAEEALSQEALAAWDRAHALFVSPRISTPQLYAALSYSQVARVLAAVVSYELSPPVSRDGREGLGGGVAGPTGHVGAAWLETVCKSLLQRRGKDSSGTAFLPPASTLVDLLRLASRVLRDRENGDSRSLADVHDCKAAAAVTEYVRCCLTDHATRGEGDGATAGSLSFGEWSLMLLAAQGAGIRLEPAVVSACAVSLFGGAAERIRAALAEGASVAAPDASALLQSAWSELSDGVQRILLPALPFTYNNGPQAHAIREGLSAMAPALGAASSRQLALLCAWTSQAGPELAPTESWWVHVRAEVIRRLPPPPASQQLSTADGLLKLARAAAAFTAAELGIILHGVLAGGCEVPTEGQAWLGSLLQAERIREIVGRDAAAPAVPQGGAVFLGGAPAAHGSLFALQHLWAARCCGCLADVPDAVWAAAYGGMGLALTAPMQALRPQQLVQLVALRAERQRQQAGGDGRPEPATPPVAAWFAEAWMAALAEQMQLQPPAFGAQTPVVTVGVAFSCGLPSSPIIAAWALTYCLPGGDGPWCRGASNRPLLPPFMQPLLLAALPALADEASLPLPDVTAFLAAMEGRPGWELPQPQLTALVARLMAGLAPEEATASRMPSAGARQLQAHGIFGAPDERAALSAAELVQATCAVLRALPPAAESFSSVLPILHALAPYAEEELYGMALADAAPRAVLAVGLEAGVNALCLHDSPLGWEAAATSASEAACALAAMLRSGVFDGLEERVNGSAGHRDGRVRKGQTAKLPPAALAQLAEAIIAAGGRRNLPHAAAAVLMRLLAADGVVPLVPMPALDVAVSHSLQGGGVPMPDCVAAALVTAASPGGGGCGSFPGSANGTESSDVIYTAALRRCGASSVWAQAALLNYEYLRYKDVAEVLAMLDELQACGVRERLAVTQRPMVSKQEAVGPDGPFAKLVVGLTSCLFHYAELGLLTLSDTAAALRCVWTLLHRLDGATCLAMYANIYFIINNTVSRHDPAALAKTVRRDPAVLWSFLEAAHELGGQRFNTHFFGSHLLVEGQHVDEAKTIGAEQSDAYKTPSQDEGTEVAARALPALGLLYVYVADHGPFFLEPQHALLLWQAAQPLVEAHKLAELEAVMSDRGIKQDGQAKAAWTAAAYAPEASGSGSGPLLKDPRLLAPRHLGLLYGMLVLRSAAGTDGLKSELQEAIDKSQLDLMYADAIAGLSNHGDGLAPLAHLTAILDALEPVAVPYLEGNLRPARLYYKGFSIHSVVGVPLVRALLDSPAAEDALYPPGVAPWDDRSLVRSHIEPTEEVLLNALYMRELEPIGERCALPRAYTDGGGAGTADGLTFTLEHQDTAAWAARHPRLALPLALRPPPGRRHGMPGDAAGDAAREAYVREIAPWLRVAWRLCRLVKIAEINVRENLAPMCRLPGEGRLATALRYALQPDVAEWRIYELLLDAGVELPLPGAFQVLPFLALEQETRLGEEGNGDEPWSLAEQLKRRRLTIPSNGFMGMNRGRGNGIARKAPGKRKGEGREDDTGAGKGTKSKGFGGGRNKAKK